jgi:hypothetical protein
MISFFSPKGRLSVSRHVAVTMNTLNVLAPSLLLLSLILVATAKLGDLPFEMRQLLTQYAIGLAVTALLLRVLWGLGIRVLRSDR